MNRKDVTLVMVVILIPIVIMGAIAVTGAHNLPESEDNGGNESGENTTASVAFSSPLPAEVPAGLVVPEPAYALG